MANIIGFIKQPTTGLVSKFLNELTQGNAQKIMKQFFDEPLKKKVLSAAEDFLVKPKLILPELPQSAPVRLRMHVDKNAPHNPIVILTGSYQHLAEMGGDQTTQVIKNALNTTRKTVQGYGEQPKDFLPYSFHTLVFRVPGNKLKMFEKGLGKSFSDVQPGAYAKLRDQRLLSDFLQKGYLGDAISVGVGRGVSQFDTGVFNGVDGGLPLQKIPEMTFQNIFDLTQDVGTGRIIQPIHFKYRQSQYQFNFDMGMPFEPGGVASVTEEFPNRKGYSYGRNIYQAMIESLPAGDIHFAGASSRNSSTGHFAANNGYWGKYASGLYGYYGGGLVANPATAYYVRTKDPLVFMATNKVPGRVFGKGLKTNSELNPSTFEGWGALQDRIQSALNRDVPAGDIKGDKNGFFIFGHRVKDLSYHILPVSIGSALLWKTGIPYDFNYNYQLMS